MRESLKRIQLVLGLVVLAGAGVVYLQIFTPPGTPGWANCLILFMLLSLLVLIAYAGCAISCGGDPDKPLDPKCVDRCVRFLWWAEGVLIIFLFGCIAGARLF